MLKTTNLEVECDDSARTKIKAWFECTTSDDVDDVIAWLRLARSMMLAWERIRAKRHAKISHAAKTASGQNEDAKSGKVQGKPQIAVGANGE